MNKHTHTHWTTVYFGFMLIFLFFFGLLSPSNQFLFFKKRFNFEIPHCFSFIMRALWFFCLFIMHFYLQHINFLSIISLIEFHFFFWNWSNLWYFASWMFVAYLNFELKQKMIIAPWLLFVFIKRITCGLVWRVACSIFSCPLWI